MLFTTLRKWKKRKPLRYDHRIEFQISLRCISAPNGARSWRPGRNKLGNGKPPKIRTSSEKCAESQLSGARFVGWYLLCKALHLKKTVIFPNCYLSIRYYLKTCSMTKDSKEIRTGETIAPKNLARLPVL